MMTEDLESKFEAIARRAIESAEQLECSFEEFVEGIEFMAEIVSERAETAAEEAEGRG